MHIYTAANIPSLPSLTHPTHLNILFLTQQTHLNNPLTHQTHPPTDIYLTLPIHNSPPLTPPLTPTLFLSFRPALSGLYEGGCLFDRFSVICNHEGTKFLTGGYSNRFGVYNALTGAKVRDVSLPGAAPFFSDPSVIARGQGLGHLGVTPLEAPVDLVKESAKSFLGKSLIPCGLLLLLSYTLSHILTQLSNTSLNTSCCTISSPLFHPHSQPPSLILSLNPLSLCQPPLSPPLTRYLDISGRSLVSMGLTPKPPSPSPGPSAKALSAKLGMGGGDKDKERNRGGTPTVSTASCSRSSSSSSIPSSSSSYSAGTFH